MLLVLAAVTSFARADDVVRPVTSDLRALLKKAIYAPDGSARAVLRTPETEAIGRHFQAGSPLYADVDTELVFSQEGCRRLRLTLRYESVVLPDGHGPQAHTMVYRFNFCREGGPLRALDVKGEQP